LTNLYNTGVFVGETILKYGIDSPEHIPDFYNYPDKVEYQFNSKGFRDKEWPQLQSELTNTPWIFGDSFIVGLGQPENQRISSLLGAINISMSGASNDWIARMCAQVIQDYQPRCIAVHWTYLQRREDPDTTKLDYERRLYYTEESLMNKSLNLANIKHHITTIEQLAQSNQVCCVHSFVSEPLEKQSHVLELQPLVENMLPRIPQTDFSRDKWHYGIETSQQYAQGISEIWKTKY